MAKFESPKAVIHRLHRIIDDSSLTRSEHTQSGDQETLVAIREIALPSIEDVLMKIRERIYKGNFKQMLIESAEQTSKEIEHHIEKNSIPIGAMPECAKFKTTLHIETGDEHRDANLVDEAEQYLQNEIVGRMLAEGILSEKDIQTRERMEGDMRKMLTLTSIESLHNEQNFSRMKLVSRQATSGNPIVRLITQKDSKWGAIIGKAAAAIRKSPDEVLSMCVEDCRNQIVEVQQIHNRLFLFSALCEFALDIKRK